MSPSTLAAALLRIKNAIIHAHEGRDDAAREDALDAMRLIRMALKEGDDSFDSALLDGRIVQATPGGALDHGDDLRAREVGT